MIHMRPMLYRLDDLEDSGVRYVRRRRGNYVAWRFYGHDASWQRVQHLFWWFWWSVGEPMFMHPSNFMRVPEEKSSETLAG